MENHRCTWLLIIAAALLAVNALTVNPKPQHVTRLVKQGLVWNQEIPMAGPVDPPK